MGNNENQRELEVNKVLEINQEHVPFDGERLVINTAVRNSLNDVLQEHIERYKFACNFVKGKKVLDAASGAGYGAKMLSVSGAESIVGIDLSIDSVNSARETYSAENIEFTQGDVCTLNFPDATFDVVVSFETIEHIKSGSVLIDEAARVLKDDGILIVSTPNRDVTNPGIYSTERPMNHFHEFEYNVNEFVGDLLEKYDLLGLYGQTIIPNSNNHFSQIIRSARQLGSGVPAPFAGNYGHTLVPFSTLKDAQPMYLVAFCKKK